MNMKKIIYLIVAGLVINSCNNLDLQPLDKLPASSGYKTSAEFDGAIFAAYSSIQDFWGTSTETLSESGEYWKISVVTSDDVKAEANSDQISKSADVLNIKPSDIPFAAIYTQIYEGIYRCNTVLEYLKLKNELTDNQKSQFEGEAKFLRAFFHFEALKLWGKTPLVLATPKGLSTLSVSNSAPDQKDKLFTQILDDFKDAFDKLPAAWDADNTGRATKWASRAFTGKVNVWKKDMPAAVTAFADVIANGPFGLIDTNNPTQDLEDVFAFDNENNKESIFECQFGGPHSDDNIWVFDDTHSESFKASQGTGRSWYWDASSDRGAVGDKRGWWNPTADLVNSFEPGDARLNSFIYQSGDTYNVWNSAVVEMPFDPAWSSTGFIVKKYGGKRNSVGGDFSGNNQGNFNNERLYRFAEMKLLYAEALLSTNPSEATKQVNDIRNRAGLPNLAGTATLTDIQHEKRVELCFEPHRWFDIARWGIGATIFPTEWQNKYSVYPFPQSEIDRTRGLDASQQIKQNDGY
jgi:starch-binding outer membrane protein, SusD/RagB family